MNPWLKPKAQREYLGGIDKRTYREWRRKGLRVVQVGGVCLSKVKWLDQFVLSHEEGAEVTNQAKAILRKLK